MILIKIMIFCISALAMIAGIVTMVSPDVNTVFLPIFVEGVQESHFARSYAGFVAAVGYLAMRFLYSSSKVQVGTVVLYILFIMIISKMFSFIYDGYTTFAVISFLMGVVFAIGLYAIQKARKNQLDYNL
tara:strand:+ start:1014 stop:1403 length:390 start_codon:yes stop_codon:yes gene_type:complete